jgi:hypothetical protein
MTRTPRQHSSTLNRKKLTSSVAIHSPPKAELVTESYSKSAVDYLTNATQRDQRWIQHAEQFIKQRAVARGMLSRIQIIEVGNQKINEIQLRFNKLPDIFNRYDAAQSELELSDDTDHSGDREKIETNTTKLRQSSVSFYILL